MLLAKKDFSKNNQNLFWAKSPSNLFLCCNGMDQLWEIPWWVRKITVELHDRPAKNRHKVLVMLDNSYYKPIGMFEIPKRHGSNIAKHCLARLANKLLREGHKYVYAEVKY